MSQIDKVITIKLANKMLPLVSRIVADIVESAAAVDWRQGHLTQDFDAGDDLYGDELRAIEIELERDAARLAKVQGELVSLGVELKDPLNGVVHFPAVMEGQPVYLCWRLGEDEVGFWHHRHEGFEERRSLVVSPASN
jgi:hypothetical protein